MKRKMFCCYFYFQEWHYINLGIHLDLSRPNMEIHIPFGFIRIGWKWVYDVPSINAGKLDWKIFGYDPARGRI